MCLNKVSYLPHSRISLDEPSRTAIRFPKELRAMSRFSPLTALLDPKTAVKKRLAAIWVDPAISFFGTVRSC